VPSSPSLSDPHLMAQSSQPVQLRRSGLAVFGWLVLAALLFGGVGALLYVALGERGERSPGKLDEAGQPPPRLGVGSEAPPPEGSGSAVDPKAGSGAVKVAVGSAGSGSGAGSDEPPVGDGSAQPGATDDPDRKGDGKKPGTGPRGQGQIRRPTAAADERDPKALIRQGKQHEKNGDWEAARTTYQKLEKIKGYAGIALYQQAWVAIHTNETDAAIQLAIRSAAQPGTHKIDAKFLYGDALYKQGEFRRAKDIFISLRKTLTGEQKATATRKIAAANRALKLPENDGIEKDD